MRDHILESIFLDTSLWREVIEHGVEKRIPNHLLERFADPHVRADLCVKIGDGEYTIQPPHTGYRKKDDGGERMFLANEPEDRLLLNIIYKWLMKNESSMIHPSCKSYQSGIGIGKIVKEISHRITCNGTEDAGKVVGRKYDIHKYFDSIPREHIYGALETVEKDFGNSSIIDLLFEYYDTDIYYDTRQHSLVEEYQGIKQGCAVSAWLANVLLYSLDEKLSKRNGVYVRYSDDILYIGKDYEEVTDIIREHLSQMGLQLNERKVTDIISGEYFCFLGFDIHGKDITLSKKWVNHFQKEIDRRTIRNTKLITKVRDIRKVGGKEQETKLRRIVENTAKNLTRYLLYGNGTYSWATEVLPVVNKTVDIQQLTLYCLDALRAVYTGHTSIGGLGKSLRHGIQRGKGKHVLSNLFATLHLEHPEDGSKPFVRFMSLTAAQKTVSNKWLFRTVTVNLIDSFKHPVYGRNVTRSNLVSREEIITELETLYSTYLNSRPDGSTVERFYANPLDEMTMEGLVVSDNRREAMEQLEKYLEDNVDFSILNESEKSWYWQSDKYPQLVLLKEWFENID